MMRAIHAAVTDGNVRVSQVVEVTGFPPGTVRVCLRRMYSYGWLENPGRGVYVPTGISPVFDESTPRRGKGNYAETRREGHSMSELTKMIIVVPVRADVERSDTTDALALEAANRKSETPVDEVAFIGRSDWSEPGFHKLASSAMGTEAKRPE
jgi:hypothetical protein